MPIGPRAGDQHILAHQAEAECGMRRVSEGVEDRGHLVADPIGDLEGVDRGNRQILGKGAGAVDTDANGVAAQMPPPGAAIAAEAAGDVAFARDAVADGEAAHLGAHVDHLADIFMTHLHRHGDGLLRPFVPFPDMAVGAADRRLLDLDQHVVVADLGLRHVGQGEAGRPFQFRQSSHVQTAFFVAPMAPNCLPTLAKAATAWSMWSLVCAALIWVRMRACPFGTTGKEKPMT